MPADGTIIESDLHIYTQAGAFTVPQLDRSFASFDGEHGYGIVQSAWSPNSEYFVFTEGWLVSASPRSHEWRRTTWM